MKHDQATNHHGYVDPGDIYFVRDHDRSDYVCYECAERLAPEVYEAAMETFE